MCRVTRTAIEHQDYSDDLKTFARDRTILSEESLTADQNP